MMNNKNPENMEKYVEELEQTIHQLNKELENERKYRISAQK